MDGDSVPTKKKRERKNLSHFPRTKKESPHLTL